MGLDLKGKLQNEHPKRIAFTWTCGSGSGQLFSYFDLVLVGRVDLDLFGGPSFESLAYYDLKLVCVPLRLEKSKVYRKFNAGLLEKKDLRNQLELTRKQTGVVIGNIWRATLSSKIGFFVTNYSRRRKLHKAVAQKALEFNMTVKVEDCSETNLIIAELAFILNKKYQTRMVKAKLKRMSYEATNMTHELQTEELRDAPQCNIVSVTSMDERCLTTNEAISE